MHTRTARRRLTALFAVAMLASVFSAPAQGGLNSDGNVDVVVGTDLGLVCIGDGLGGFSCSTTSGLTNDASDVELGLIDGDATLDAVTISLGGEELCLGTGTGGFNCSTIAGITLTDVRAVAIGLIDGDGFADLFFSGGNGFPGTTPNAQVCLGNGAGMFSCQPPFPAAPGFAFEVELGFFDGGSTLDAVIGTPFGEAQRLCKGDGFGGFSCQNLTVDPNDEIAVSGIETGFLDGDPHLDVVFGSSLSADPNLVCFGDGTGGFSCDPLDPAPVGSSRITTGVTVGFVDAGDTLDIVFANSLDLFVGGTASRTCLGDGLGGFTCADASSDLTISGDIDGGYINTDGFLDIVVGNRLGPDNVCLGVGDGTFVCSDISAVAGDTLSVAVTPSTRPSPRATVFVSSSTGGTVGGLSFADEDILVHRPSGAWEMHFDGSDVGLAGADFDAFAVRDDGDAQTLDPIYLSLTAPLTLPSGRTIDDSDIVIFTPTSLGTTTAGSFAFHFDGSDVGLTTNGEDVDAIAFDGAGRLVISTARGFSVPRTGGGTLNGRDEDLIVFNDVSFGGFTSGDFEIYFDGSDVGLTASAEDVWGASIDASTGDVYLTTRGGYSVAGLSGDRDDVVRFEPTSPPGPVTSGVFSAFWDGDLFGYGGERIDGLTVIP